MIAPKPRPETPPGAKPPARAPARAPGARPNWAAAGLSAPAERPDLDTVERVVADYLAGADYAGLAASTRRNYAMYLGDFTAVFGGCAVDDLRPVDLQHWIGATTPGSQAARRCVVAVVWRHCVREGVAQGASPLRGVRVAPARPRARYVTDDELALFVAGCCERLRAYLALKMATGLRRGQLRALSWSDWDGDELYAPPAKRGVATRYHGDAVRAAVAAVRAAYWRGAEPRAEQALIARRDGGRYASSRTILQCEWARARAAYQRAGGPADWREHDLRAKVATDSKGLQRAQFLLGHRSPAVTERVYRRKGRRVRSASSVAAGRPDRQLDIFAVGAGGGGGGVAQWLRERCERGGEELGAALYADYRAWAGADALGLVGWARAMDGEGLAPRHTAGGNARAVALKG